MTKLPEISPVSSVPLVDSHCHLTDERLKPDLNTLLMHAATAGVVSLVNIGTTLCESKEVIQQAEAYQGVYATVGVHPHEVASEGVPQVEEIYHLAAHPKVIGLGETGLDYYYEHTDRAQQRDSLVSHIIAAHSLDLPLIIHSRDGEEDLLKILIDNQKFLLDMPGVIHCFSGSAFFAEEALKLGFYISLSGIITFKKSTDLQEIVKMIPLDKLLIETDAPYLAPVPKRGKPNEPAYVYYTAQKLAELKGVSLEEVGKITTQNFFTLFKKAAENKESLQ